MDSKRQTLEFFNTVYELLEIGQFPGSVAVHVALSRRRIETIIKGLESEQESQQQPDTESLRSEEERPGLGDS